MVAAVLVGMVILLLGATAVELSLHNVFAGAYSRSEVQALHAAEAGIDEANVVVSGSVGAQLPCTLDQTLPTSPGASFHVAITYYGSYPPSAQSSLTCTPGAGPDGAPAGAILVSEGTAPATGADQAHETMEEQVSLTPVYAPFTDAIFSNQTIATQRTLTVYGSGSDNGDVYTNGSYSCQQNDTINGSVEAQGFVDLGGNCSIAGSVWADGAIAATRADSIGGDATSSSSCILLNSGDHTGGPGGSAPVCPSQGSGNPTGPAPGSQSAPIIAGNATAGTTCTFASGPCGSPEVGGTVVQDHPQPPPPQQSFPVVGFDPTAWSAQGYAIETYSGPEACSEAESAIDSGQFGSTPTVVDVTTDCALIWPPANAKPGPGGYPITLGANLAIVTNGPIFLDHDVTFEATTSSPVELFLIVPDTAQNQADCVFASTPGAPPPSANDQLSRIKGGTRPGQEAVTSPDIDSEDNTVFSNVDVVYYTPCSVDTEEPTLTGQIYAGSLVLENQLSLSFDPILIPGNGVPTGYKVGIAYERQVATPGS